MAGGAVRRKSGTFMLGIACIPIIPGMTGKTFRNSGLKLERRMAPVTGDGLMRTGQPESGLGVVNPVGGRPSERSMATSAFEAETGPVRIILPANPVTGFAVTRRVPCIPSRVTVFARSHKVSAGQHEIGRVGHLCIQRQFPCVRLVAILALNAKSTLVRILVTARADPVHRPIMVVGMAGRTVVEFGMAPGQRETGDRMIE